MKKMLATLLVVAASSVGSAVFAGTPIKQSELPQTAQAFITKYFSNDGVKKVEKDNGRRGMEYEVDFNSGAEVEFNSDGRWKEVKAAKGKSVPADIVPSAISQYVNTNHKGQTVVEIERKRGGYELKLSNGSELKLTEDAKPLPEGKGRGGRGGQGRQGGRGQR